MQKLKIGIPKGSLENATIELFKKSGWKITTSSRSYFPGIDDEELSCALVRAQEMPRFVENGHFIMVEEDVVITNTGARKLSTGCEKLYVIDC